MKRKILVVSHCFFNDAAKLNYQDQNQEMQEREMKRNILIQALQNNIELIQLPCPEFAFYGSNRWGHTSEQFDTPFFREQSRLLLSPVVRDLLEYSSHPDRFEIIGILGINGSPSCGVSFTCSGEYGGSLHNLGQTISRLKCTQKSTPGIFMQEFMKLLQENHLSLPFFAI